MVITKTRVKGIETGSGRGKILIGGLDDTKRSKIQPTAMIFILTSHPTAIHSQNRAVDIIRSLRSEKDHGAAQVIWFAPASRRNARDDRRVALRVLPQGCRVVGRNVARGN